MLIDNGERDFGPGWIGAADVTGNADEALLGTFAQGRDQTNVDDEIEVGHSDQFGVAERALDPEKAMIDRLFAEFPEMAQQAIAVIGPNCAHVNRATVAQHLLSAVAGEIGSHMRSRGDDIPLSRTRAAL